MNHDLQDIEQPLRTLWFDLKSSIEVAETPAIFDRFCTIRRCTGLDRREIETNDPDLVVIEFDYPSRADLQQAAAFKASHPSVPMLIITVQHSEAMAVWFFRSKFIDYLVQPVTNTESLRCLAEIKTINALRRRQQPRTLATKQSSMPLEVSRGQSASNRLLPAVMLIASSYFENLSVSRAAEVCNMMPFKFGREFKEEFGISFRDYLVRYRVREACRLLRNPHAQVSEVAYAVGFSEPSYFAKTFKRLVGTPPSQVVGHKDLTFFLSEDDDSHRNSMRSSQES